MRFLNPMRNGFLLLCYLLVGVPVLAQQQYTLSGRVMDTQGKPVPYASVWSVDENIGSTADEQGVYLLKLSEGIHRIAFSAVGYTEQRFDLVFQQDFEKQVFLVEDSKELNEVTVSTKYRDPSYEVIRQLMERRKFYDYERQSLKIEGYLKAREQVKTEPVKEREPIFKKEKKDSSTFVPDTAKRLSLYECRFILYQNGQGKLKEEKTGVTKLGAQNSLFYTSGTEASFNFFSSPMYLPSLSDNAFVSPFGSAGFLSYKFKLIESYFENGQKIYHIRISPRSLGNALFKGEVWVRDSVFTLQRIKVSLPTHTMPEYDEMEADIRYEMHNDSLVIPSVQEFHYRSVFGRSDARGRSVVYYQSIKDTVYAPKFFSNEISRTQEEAYQRDSAFWAGSRLEPLSLDEIKAIQRRDSLREWMESASFLDSLDSMYNRVTLLKLLWDGQGHINRAKKQTFEFSPLISVIDPVAIGGFRVRYYIEYFKRFENRKSFFLVPFASYGFLNKDLNWNLYSGYTYNPLKLSSVRLRLSKNFDLINPYDAFINMFRRSNFYLSRSVNISHSTELFNGFYLFSGLELDRRTNLKNFKFSALGDQVFENNVPADFDNHTAVVSNIGISYTPFQQYMREPKEKIILGSKWPSFSLNHRRAWGGNLSAGAQKFDYLEFGISQKINLGVVGVSQYHISSGKFLDTTRLQLIDYKFHRQGDPFLFTHPLYTYQLLSHTFPTFNWFLEGHYLHRFNGFIVQKIPLLRKTGIQTSAGSAFLWAPEWNYRHVEIFAGAERMFKLGRERFRLGFYYAVGQNNRAGFVHDFKISFEYYNRTRNDWTF